MRPFVIFLLPFIALATNSPAQDAKPDDYIERMEREHGTDRPEASPAARLQPANDVSSREVTYATIEGRDIVGYLAQPAAEAPTAAILVIHEWWGLNDNIRSMTRRFAGEGYLALAVDLYEGEVVETREDAARLAGASLDHPDRGRENLRQAWRYLDEQEGIDKIGVIGWCFGGGWSLETALMLGDGIDAAVIYYGRVVTDPAALRPLTAPILGIFGELDGGIPVTTVREFQMALNQLGKTASIHVYANADHAFANPSGTRYNEQAATDAWQKTLAFLSHNLQ